mmetsp:Transcript_24020/g.52039  ORF Transcript_24020/g.52039 Transcript_24020/m.52039 type:complete len:263 (-) Transcript_24020:98-886(-)
MMRFVSGSQTPLNQRAAELHADVGVGASHGGLVLARSTGGTATRQIDLGVGAKERERFGSAGTVDVAVGDANLLQSVCQDLRLLSRQIQSNHRPVPDVQTRAHFRGKLGLAGVEPASLLPREGRRVLGGGRRQHHLDHLPELVEGHVHGLADRDSEPPYLLGKRCRAAGSVNETKVTPLSEDGSHIRAVLLGTPLDDVSTTVDRAQSSLQTGHELHLIFPTPLGPFVFFGMGGGGQRKRKQNILEEDLQAGVDIKTLDALHT